jgi:hypothetical protein
MPSTRRLLTFLFAATLATTPFATAPLNAQHLGAPPPRELSGTVTSPSHEPLRGAVVEIQAGEGAQIRSYITAEDGRYHFKALNSEADYTIWVVFRNRHSKSKAISKFDSHPDKVIDFTVETF